MRRPALRGLRASGGGRRRVRVAVVDLGTNTCRLFLAEVGDAGERGARDARLTTVVRLGQGVDRSGRLHPDAVARTRACLAGYAPRLEAYGPARRLLVATSVLRDAADGRDFLDGVERDFALPSRVLERRRGGRPRLSRRHGRARRPGRRPAGARRHRRRQHRVRRRRRRRRSRTSCAASTSASCASPSASCADDPPAAAELDRLTAFVAGAIADGVPAAVRGAARGAVGVAGTYTTLVAHKLGLREYRPELVHGHVLSLADIEAAIAVFARAHQRAARPSARHPEGARGRDPRRRPDRPRGLPRLRPRRGALQRGRHPRGRGAGARGGLAAPG